MEHICQERHNTREDHLYQYSTYTCLLSHQKNPSNDSGQVDIPAGQDGQCTIEQAFLVPSQVLERFYQGSSLQPIQMHCIWLTYQIHIPLQPTLRYTSMREQIVLAAPVCFPC